MKSAEDYIKHIMELRGILIGISEMYYEDGDCGSSYEIEMTLEESYKEFPDLQAEIIEFRPRK